MSALLTYASNLKQLKLSTFFGFITENKNLDLLSNYINFIFKINNIEHNTQNIDVSDPNWVYNLPPLTSNDIFFIRFADLLDLKFLNLLLQASEFKSVFRDSVGLVFHVFEHFLKHNGCLQDHEVEYNALVDFVKEALINGKVKGLLVRVWDDIMEQGGNVVLHNVLVLNWIVLLADGNEVVFDERYKIEYDTMGRVFI